MHPLRLTIYLLLVTVANCFAQEREAFPGLQTLQITGGYYELKPKISFVPALTSVVNKVIPNDADVFDVNVLNTYLDASKSTAYNVRYSEGGSADPMYSLCELRDPKVCHDIPGLELYMPGNGFIYASGHANTMFNVHRKYRVLDKKLVEVTQPCLYVGLDTEALAELTLYSDKTLRSEIASIPKGGKITVLINDGDFYLLKTQFGLVGWIKPASAQSEKENGIKGLFYRGD